MDNQIMRTNAGRITGWSPAAQCIPEMEYSMTNQRRTDGSLTEENFARFRAAYPGLEA